MTGNHMPWSSITETHGFWGFLGVLMGVIGTFAIAVIRLLTGREIGFRDDLLRRIQHLEQSMEEQRRHYEAQIEEMRVRHRETITQIRDEYREELARIAQRYGEG